MGWEEILTLIDWALVVATAFMRPTMEATSSSITINLRLAMWQLGLIVYHFAD